MDRTCAVDRRHGMYGGIYLINEKHKKNRAAGASYEAPAALLSLCEIL